MKIARSVLRECYSRIPLLSMPARVRLAEQKFRNVNRATLARWIKAAILGGKINTFLCTVKKLY